MKTRYWLIIFSSVLITAFLTYFFITKKSAITALVDPSSKISYASSPSPLRLQGKTAIIVGASKGIGRAIAEVFAEQGAKLLLVSRDVDKLKDLVGVIHEKGGVASYIQGDVKSQEDMEAMAKAMKALYGRIDILCYNTGIYPRAAFVNMTEAQWDEVVDTNLKGAFLAMKACVPYMIEQNEGRILLTSSVSGPQVGLPLRAHYTASKAGLNGLMLTTAIELAKYNILVNGVEPGLIMTEGVEALGKDHIALMEQAIPLKALGKPRDVANAMLFLASDEAQFITGQTIIVDGGQVLPESHFDM